MDAAGDPVQKIATAVLYEGYVLWPYRRSAIKNQQRWTIGGVYPPAYSALQAGSDPSEVRAECLVSGDAPVLTVTVRCLHVVERRVAQLAPEGELVFVDELRVGSERYLAWDEATEREVTAERVQLADLGDVANIPFHFPAGSEREPLIGPDGGAVGVLLRRWRGLEGVVEIGAVPLAPGLSKVSVSIQNTTPWQDGGRESAQKQTLISAHAVLRVTGGEFVSLIDPPVEVRSYVARCEQSHLWPVLVGEDGMRDTMLAAPIILYDYPAIAPESPGDLFDGTEIDQLLTMTILSMTDEEKVEMRATDPRTRAILERTEALTADDFMRLHGAIREFQVLRPGGPTPLVGQSDEVVAPAAPLPTLWGDLVTPGPESVAVGGVALRCGSMVRLRPKPGGDIFDIALAGQVATIQSIEEDDAGALHVTVTVASDPGSDLGQERQIGHRFFFALDEVEPIEDRAGDSDGEERQP